MRVLDPVRHNIIANLAGRAWTSLISLIFIPFFIKLMGVEAYGLLGFFASLTALLAILDMGLSSTLSRELSRLSSIDGTEQESRDLVRTLEVVYWGVGIIIGLSVVLFAPLIAHYWVNSQGVTTSTVETAVMLMGFTVASQWPSSLYAGGLMGLQRQVLLNVVRVIMVTIQYGGAVLVLWLVSPTILTFFVWEFFVGLVNTLVLVISLGKALAGSGLQARCKMSLLKSHWNFAANMTVISILVTILTQLDKILLSKMLSLQMFGYYMLAFNIAGSLNYLITPLYNAYYPRFCQLAMSSSYSEMLSTLYHKACQLMAAVVFPIAVALAFFSKQILLLWIHDPVVVENTYVLLSIIVTGTALNAVLTMPYALQLAYGYTKIVLIQNVICVIVLVPLMLLLIKHYGANGAAIVWVLLNTGVLLFSIPVMHRRYLKYEMKKWFVFDVGLPLITVSLIGFFSYLLMPSASSILFCFIWISVSFLLLTFSCLSVMPEGRGWIRQYLFQNIYNIFRIR